MFITKTLVCPKCKSNDFIAKREATYLYSYKLNKDNSENSKEETEPLPFLFDNREQTNSKEYIECEDCGSQYPCDLKMDGKEIDFTILQKAIRSDHTTNPEFLG
ncbi:hypothetical protein [Anaeromicrobium sediminis]|uniref:Uncharacterized protein n=1 Tax=Anaeromicrobium sediminis TaxID=1478221 RepID=A0A267MGD8_9FIRM|nr:hypothetical protein [Anaeromicrobium sediminis]PAB57860.1 hypothetical protein CCE28_17845 [Anaeromicrobium sediminis]